MKIEDAIEIVICLARQNHLQPAIGDCEALRDESRRQSEAINVIEDFFTNVVFK